MARKSVFQAKIAEYTAMLASGLMDPSELEPRVLSRHVVEAIKRVSQLLVDEAEGGNLYCRLCNKGPYTRKGMYLHLIRVHNSTIIDLVTAESERIYSSSKHVKP
ncbi:hypothetical protein [Stetteria hydrogenophila]